MASSSSIFQIIRGEIENPYPLEHELLVQDCLLQACGHPLNEGHAGLGMAAIQLATPRAEMARWCASSTTPSASWDATSGIPRRRGGAKEGEAAQRPRAGSGCGTMHRDASFDMRCVI
jgi:hypothetical protein